MLGPLCNQALQNSVLQYTEIKIESLYFKAQQRLKEVYIIKQQP